jgi:3-(3-hydroxy-phenyl)propionate hydroxylase
VNNPLGGMGMNSGLHDAVLVARALVNVLADRSQPGAMLAELDEVLEARRDVALSYVRAITHDNWKNLRETDESARAAHHASLRELAADHEASRLYLRRTSMIDSLRPLVGDEVPA